MIPDDIGYVQYSREEMEVLFALLAERDERGSVVLTSNLAFSGWETIFKDPMTTAAAIDRLVHHSDLELNGPIYRAEQAKKAGQKPSDSPIQARRCDWKQARIPPRARGNSRRPQFKRLVHYPRGGNSNCRQKGNLIVANQGRFIRPVCGWRRLWVRFGTRSSETWTRKKGVPRGATQPPGRLHRQGPGRGET